MSIGTGGWRQAALAAALAGIAILSGCASSGKRASEDLTWKKARIRYDLGLDHLSKGRTALAIRDFLEAQRLDEKDPWIPLALAEAYRRKGRLDDSEHFLRQALELDPAFQAAQLNLSALYVQQERYEEAIRLAEPLAADPTFPDPWRALTNLGWAEYKVGRLQEARRHLERAVDFDPGYWPALLDLGILEAQEGHRVEALNYFERVLQARPARRAEAEAHYRMAEIYIALGHRDQAIEHLTAARERLPRSLWGKRSAEYLKILR